VFTAGPEKITKMVANKNTGPILLEASKIAASELTKTVPGGGGTQDEAEELGSHLCNRPGLVRCVLIKST
jgi:hypothetical protein